MGYDNTNSQTQLNTENYCISGDIPEIKIFDSSTGNILEIISGDVLPGWQLNIAHVIYNISFANNGITAPDIGWNFYLLKEAKKIYSLPPYLIKQIYFLL